MQVFIFKILLLRLRLHRIIHFYLFQNLKLQQPYCCTNNSAPSELVLKPCARELLILDMKIRPGPPVQVPELTWAEPSRGSSWSRPDPYLNAHWTPRSAPGPARVTWGSGRRAELGHVTGQVARRDQVQVPRPIERLDLGHMTTWPRIFLSH